MVVTDSTLKKSTKRKKKQMKKRKKKKRKQNTFATSALLHKKNQERSININVLQTLGTSTLTLGLLERLTQPTFTG